MSDVKIFAKIIEPLAKLQIDLLASQPAFSNSKIRIMPDVHAGAGCVIGFTADLGDKVIPNVVGVDIGCGMLTVDLGKRDIDYERLDRVIRKNVPFGMNVHHSYNTCMYYDESMRIVNNLRCIDHMSNTSRLFLSMGTLGGGNHFIEIDKDDDENKYLVIHTGSRNLGKQVAQYYQNIAIDHLHGRDENTKKRRQALIDEYKASGRGKEIPKMLREFDIQNHKGPKSELDNIAWLEGEDAANYLHDMKLCQEFAEVNRAAIYIQIITGMGWDLHPAWASFHTVHNYIDPSDNIVRKGAVSAREGQPLLIPMNMRDGSLICVGKGNEDWNQSAPHGAGRLMSRKQARKELSMSNFAYAMKDVWTTSVGEDTLDESPDAYKPMDAIIPLLEDTVSIVKHIKPVYNFKAGE